MTRGVFISYYSQPLAHRFVNVLQFDTGISLFCERSSTWQQLICTIATTASTSFGVF